VSKKVDLHIDWATHKAAKYACEHWHYAGCVPRFKQVWIGAWENQKFIGIVSIGKSSTPYLGTFLGLETTECAELTRIALKSHQSQVSQIMMYAIKMVKKQSPNLKLLVSLADSTQGHEGKIYQATNWVYVGRSSSMTQYYFRGKWRNDSPLMRYLQKHPEEKKRLPKRKIPGKHKYLMPLDKKIRKQIAPLSQPYPTSGDSTGEGAPPEQEQFSGVKREGLIELVRKNLTPGLLKPQFREQNKKNPMYGHCYVATEAMFHLLGGKDGYFAPCCGKDSEGIVHWWLQDKRSGAIVDITADQYYSVGKKPPYFKGKRKGFLTKVPSKRAKILIERVKQAAEGGDGPDQGHSGGSTPTQPLQA